MKLPPPRIVAHKQNELEVIKNSNVSYGTNYGFTGLAIDTWSYKVPKNRFEWGCCPCINCITFIWKNNTWFGAINIVCIFIERQEFFHKLTLYVMF